MVGAVTGNAFGSVGRRAAGTPAKTVGTSLPFYLFAGATMFMAPVAGLYSFRLWGPGGNGVSSPAYASGAAGGGYVKKTIRLAGGQAIPLTISTAASGAASTVTLPGGAIQATAGGAGSASSTAVGGVGSGGDVNLTGGTGNRSNNPAVYGGTGGGSFPGQPGLSQVYSGSGYGGGGSAPGDEVQTGGNGGGFQANASATGSFPGGGGTAGNSGGDGLLIVTYQGA